MPDTRLEIKNHLEQLLTQDEVEGAVLVSRDGIAVVDASKRPMNPEIFSAMSAMMIGAAETLAAELGHDAPDHLVVRGARYTLVIRGVSDELLLVVLGGPDMAVDALSGALDSVAKTIDKMAG